jgi:hypothetical protein
MFADYPATVYMGKQGQNATQFSGFYVIEGELQEGFPYLRFELCSHGARRAA